MLRKYRGNRLRKPSRLNSPIVYLQEDAIILNTSIPYVRILPDGRRLKTEDSRREIPLVGAALAAMRKRPQGFPRYRDKSSNLSATLNKYLLENGLRPTKDHTVYSLRHSFKDRLVAAEAPDSLIDSLMGQQGGRTDQQPVERRRVGFGAIVLQPRTAKSFWMLTLQRQFLPRRNNPERFSK